MFKRFKVTGINENPKKPKRNLMKYLALGCVMALPAFALLKTGVLSMNKNVLAADQNKYDIVADLDGGKFEMGTTPEFTKMDNGNWLYKYKPVPTPTKLPAPVKDGYDFTGWTVSAKPDIQKEYSIPAWHKGNLNVKANWKSKGSMLYDGITFNETIYSLLMNIDGYSPSNDLSIKFIKGIPLEVNSYPNTSVGDGVIAYFKNGVLYVASNDTIYANSDCSSMFDLIYYRTGGNINRTSRSLIDHSQHNYVGHLKINSIEFDNFNTVNVTNMEGMFRHCDLLTRMDLSNFDTSNVTNMSYMFVSCSSLTSLDLSNFGTSKVTDMSYMFRNCSKLNGSIMISNPNITSYTGIFENCSTDPNAKFYVKFVDDASKESAKKLVSTKSSNSNVFLYEASTLVNSDKFSTAFSKAAIGLDIWKDYTIKFSKGNPVISEYQPDISEAQDGSISISADESSGHKSNMIHVTSNKIIKFNRDSSFMFYNKPTGVFKFENIDTSGAENMDYMFSEIGNYDNFSLDLSKFNTESVRTANKMFYNSNLILDIKGLADFNFGNLISANEMFAGCSRLSGSITISNPNIASYIDMFKDCSTDPNAKFIVKYTSPETKVIAEQMVATKSSNSNVYLDGTQPVNLVDGSTFNKKLYSMLKHANEVRFIKGVPDPNGVDVSLEGDGSIKANLTGDILNIASDGEIMANPDSSLMFSFGDAAFIGIRKIVFDNFNTSKVTTMRMFFSECQFLEVVEGIENWDTSNVRNMNSMFYDCYNLQNIKLNSIDMSKVTDMTDMFHYCQELNGEIVIDNSNISSYNNMFYQCSVNKAARFIVKYKDAATKEVARKMVATKSSDSNVELYEQPAVLVDGAKFNAALNSLVWDDGSRLKVYFMRGSTDNIGSDAIDVSEAQDGSIKIHAWMRPKANTDTVIKIVSQRTIKFNSDSSGMFRRIPIRELGLDNVDTSSVTDMSYMFEGCSMLNSLDLNNFDMNQVTDMSHMFNKCSDLDGSITISSPNIKSYTQIFTECSTINNAKFIVKYTSPETKVIAEQMVATKSPNSKVYLDGMQPQPNVLVDGKTFNAAIDDKGDFHFIEFSNNYPSQVPTNAIDLSEAKDKSIILVITRSGRNVKAPEIGTYIYNRIYCKDKIILNQDCSDMFANLNTIQSIDFSNVDASRVKNASNMFRGVRAAFTPTTISGFQNLHFDNVTNIDGMFSGIADVYSYIDRMTIRNSNITNYKNVGLKYLDYISKETKVMAESIINDSTNAGMQLGNLLGNAGYTASANIDLTQGSAKPVPISYAAAHQNTKPATPQPTHQVNITLNNGSMAMYPVQKIQVNSGKIGDLAKPDLNPKYAGQFGGYFYDKNCTIPVKPNDVITQDIELYAKW